jgi:hypothetical protein
VVWGDNVWEHTLQEKPEQVAENSGASMLHLESQRRPIVIRVTHLPWSGMIAVSRYAIADGSPHHKRVFQNRKREEKSAFINKIIPLKDGAKPEQFHQLVRLYITQHPL